MTVSESVSNDLLGEKTGRSGDSNMHFFSNNPAKGWLQPSWQSYRGVAAEGQQFPVPRMPNSSRTNRGTICEASSMGNDFPGNRSVED